MTNGAGGNTRDDREIREEIFSLAGAGSDVPEDLLEEWHRVRQQRLEELRRLTGEEVQAFFLGEVEKVAEEVETLEEGGRGDAATQLRHALELGERIRWYLWLLDALPDHVTADPLSFVAGEIGWVERAGHELRRWDATLAKVAHGVLDEVERARFSLSRMKLSRFLRGGRPSGDMGSMTAVAASWSRVCEDRKSVV